MDTELAARLSALEAKLDATYAAAEKARKYLLVMTIITVGAIVLPLVGLLFAIPSFLSTYQTLGAIQ